VSTFSGEGQWVAILGVKTNEAAKVNTITVDDFSRLRRVCSVAAQPSQSVAWHPLNRPNIDRAALPGTLANHSDNAPRCVTQ